MLIKLYRFKVKKELLEDNKRINQAAVELYKKYAGNNYYEEIFLKAEDKFVKVMLIDYYSSEEQYKKIVKEVNKDQQIAKLYRDFLKTLYSKKIAEEEYIKV